MSKLSIVSTPIGNMRDITLRALDVLSESDFILCEDTRSTKKILEYYHISTPTISYHQHSGEKKVNYILDLLSQGYNLSLVSEAGTPGISDPGGRLVWEIINNKNTTIEIEAIPGPSAVTAALSVSGMPADKFCFLGFPPHKKGRKKFIYSLFEYDHTLVVYESKHRIEKFMDELISAKNAINRELDAGVAVKAVVCRELTKMYESVYRGEIEEVKNKLVDGGEDAKKGEFVIIMNIEIRN